MKQKFEYLVSGDIKRSGHQRFVKNKRNFYRFIKEKRVMSGLNSTIINELRKCMEGDKRLSLSGNSLKNKNMEYLALLMIICENIEGVNFYSNIDYLSI